MPQPSLEPQMALRAAMDRHDADRRHAHCGVTAIDLDADKRIWSEVGVAIAAAAHRLAEGCRSSGFCATRPVSAVLCARFVEAIDDQVDGPAWALIEAAARAALGPW